MELAPRIHEGHSEGRTVPGSRADSTHSLGRWFRSNCISFKTILFPPAEESEVLIGAYQEVLMSHPDQVSGQQLLPSNSPHRKPNLHILCTLQSRKSSKNGY